MRLRRGHGRGVLKASNGAVVGLLATSAFVVLFSLGCGGGGGSAVGGTIAFSRADYRFGDRLPFLIEASGEDERRVAADGPVTWSPDGRTFASYDYEVEDVLVASSDGVVRRRIHVSLCGYDLVWSPTGEALLCGYLEPNILTRVNLRTGASRQLTEDCCVLPAWSPDGRQIAYFTWGTFSQRGGYRGPSGLAMMNRDGSGKRLLAEGGIQERDPPVWSPDGRTIVFVDPVTFDILAIDANGGRPRWLYDGDARTTKQLAWSPDGTRLAFVHGDGDFELFVMNADGTGLRKLTDNRFQDEFPAWSPESDALAFSSNREGSYAIYVVDADGDSPTRLTSNDGFETDPRWLP